MGRDPGYPDDIHQYDNDPRSPFYDEDKQYDPDIEDQKADYLYDRMKEKQLDEKYEKTKREN